MLLGSTIVQAESIGIRFYGGGDTATYGPILASRNQAPTIAAEYQAADQGCVVPEDVVPFEAPRVAKLYREILPC